MNASKSFLMDCSSVVSTLKEDGKLTQQQAASFKVTFDEDRKKTKGIRVSLRLEATGDNSVQEMTGAIYQIFEPAKALADLTTSPERLKPSLVASFFGVDAGYDKVSAESFGLATGRLCLEGTRRVVATEMMQLSGFMERKGIAGPIPAAKMTSFFFLQGNEPCNAGRIHQGVLAVDLYSLGRRFLVHALWLSSS